MRDKKKELAARKQTSSKRVSELKRLFDFKKKELESQESLLLFLFVANCPEILTESMVKLIWEFMEFLKSSGYYIINEKEVFCVPFSHLVRADRLK